MRNYSDKVYFNLISTDRRKVPGIGRVTDDNKLLKELGAFFTEQKEGVSRRHYPSSHTFAIRFPSFLTYRDT